MMDTLRQDLRFALRHLVRALGEMVSHDYFGLLGVPLALGHGFTPGASETGAVIGYGLWQRRLGGATDVVGRTIRLSGHTFTIAGVAPEGPTIRSPSRSSPAFYWRPPGRPARFPRGAPAGSTRWSH